MWAQSSRELVAALRRLRSTRPSRRRPASARSRCTASGHRRVDHGAGHRRLAGPQFAQDEAAHLAVAALVLLLLRGRPARRTRGSRPRATRTRRRSGSTSQRGARAVQTTWPSSMVPALTRRARAGSAGSRVSMSGVLAPRLRRAGLALTLDGAREHAADVDVDDRRADPVREGRDRAGRVRPDARQARAGRRRRTARRCRDARRSPSPRRAGRVRGADSPSRSQARTASPGGTAARSAGVGQRASHSSSLGITRATGVCCSMNSEIRMPQAGNPARRHGSSRCPDSYQSAIALAIGREICISGAATPSD